MLTACVKQCVFQKEEGLIQGQLNHSDSRQYISQLRDQITELKNEVGHTHRHRHTRTHTLSDITAQSLLSLLKTK